MALQQAPHCISEQDYLDGEMLAEIRHEYIGGEVNAMAGASRNHPALVGNGVESLSKHLISGSCLTFSSDIVVVCDDPQGHDYSSEKPTLFIEVMSKSARRIDRLLKGNVYQTLSRLPEHVEVMRRSLNWFTEHYFLGAPVWLESIDLKVGVAKIHRRVDHQDMPNYLQQLQQQAT